MPSHLWEHFTSSPQALSLLARHKGSRQPMPAQLVDVLCKGWSTFSSVTPALELQQQVCSRSPVVAAFEFLNAQEHLLY